MFKWALLDYVTIRQAAFLLAGFDPDSDKPQTNEQEQITAMMLETLKAADGLEFRHRYDVRPPRREVHYSPWMYPGRTTEATPWEPVEFGDRLVKVSSVRAWAVKKGLHRWGCNESGIPDAGFVSSPEKPSAPDARADFAELQESLKHVQARIDEFGDRRDPTGLHIRQALHIERERLSSIVDPKQDGIGDQQADELPPDVVQHLSESNWLDQAKAYKVKLADTRELLEVSGWVPPLPSNTDHVSQVLDNQAVPQAPTTTPELSPQGKPASPQTPAHKKGGMPSGKASALTVLIETTYRALLADHPERKPTPDEVLLEIQDHDEELIIQEITEEKGILWCDPVSRAERSPVTFKTLRNRVANLQFPLENPD
ncbi:MAG: hypothetical protein H7834_16320 [Magnetococcus sp. YQC-9]